MWIYLVLLYGIFKGFREVCKKKAMQTSTSIEVLIVYSLLSFLMVVPDLKNALGMELKFYFWVALKAFLIFTAWIFSFSAIKKLPLSLYGVLDLSRVLFATSLGIIVLGERMTFYSTVGLVLVSAGLLLLKVKPRKKLKTTLENENAIQAATIELPQSGYKDFEASPEDLNKITTDKKNPDTNKIEILYIILAFASCALNALSGLMDKILMKDLNSSQLQFWYMLFLVAYYFIYAFATKKEIHWKQTFTNKWIWLLSILFVVADRSLFIANADPASKITVMTLIKQSGSIVTILAGRLVFKEKNVLHKMICALIVIAGIVIGILK